ncbi:hypothetical protein AGMMS50249_0330 [candidate division SR1 bacterium]|nr:hypothetical protein AGMMS50249_0330 [candidate division SR1 bacterium]
MKAKLFIAVTLLFLSCLLFLPTQTNAFSGGNGTQANPYLISNIADFNELGQYLATQNDWSKGKYFELTQDITEPITHALGVIDEYFPFQGNLDGKYHQIYLKQNITTSFAPALFGAITDANISNLLIDCDIYQDSTRLATAALACYATNSTITNCKVTGNISGGGETGGIIAHAWKTTLTNCCFIGDLKGTFDVGGLCGYATETKIFDSYVIANLTGRGDMGGIVGAGKFLSFKTVYFAGKVTDFNYISPTIFPILGEEIIDVDYISAYYCESWSPQGLSNPSPTKGLSKTENEMRQPAFLNILNTQSNSWKTDETIHNGFPSFKWEKIDKSNETDKKSDFSLLFHRIDRKCDKEVKYISCDGKSSIIIELISLNEFPNNAKIRLLSTDLQSPIGSLYVPESKIAGMWSEKWKEIQPSISTNLTSPYIKYTAPPDFGSEKLNSERSITFEVIIGTDTVKKEIKLIRPPVLLLHGKGDSKSRWTTFETELKNSGKYKSNFTHHVYAHDYSITRETSFKDNTEKFFVVKNALEIIKESLAQQNCIAEKIDIIAHSMGGVLVRCYDQSEYYSDDIHKVITLSTPHSGSQGSNLLWSLNETPEGKLLTENAKKFDKGDYLSDATENLQVNSKAILEYLNGANNLAKQHNIPCFAIATMILPQKSLNDYSNDFTAIAMRTAVTLGCKPLYTVDLSTEETLSLLYGEGHDIVVPIKSQLGGMNSQNSKTFLDDWHDGITSNAEAINLVKQLLNASVSDERFCRTGWKPETLIMNTQILRKEGKLFKKSNQLLGDSTPAHIEFAPHDTLVFANTQYKLTIFSSDKIKKLILITYGDNINSYREILITQNITPITGIIPSCSFGEISFIAYGLTDDGEIASTQTAFYAIPDEELTDSIDYTAHYTLYPGQQTILECVGFFTSGKELNLVGTTNVKGTMMLTYESLQNKTQISETGIITGLHPGRDTIEILGISEKIHVIIDILPYQLQVNLSFSDSTETLLSKNCELKENIILTAPKKADYKFKYWIRNGEIISTNDQISITIIQSQLITAYYESFTDITDDTSIDNFSIYPNPANSQATIDFTLHSDAMITFTIVDIYGVCYQTYTNFYQVGRYSLPVNLTNLTSGRYFYQIQVNGITIQKLGLIITR